MTRHAIAALMLATASAAPAQESQQARQMPPAALPSGGAWGPRPAPAQPDAIPLYGARTPGKDSTENWAGGGAAHYNVRNVTRPTLTPVLPDPAKATGAAVIVAPGGAFMALSMSAEGWDVARALANRGIAAFVLKYRLLPTPADEAEALRFTARTMGDALRKDSTRPLGNPDATADALAALALVRADAAKYRIDPARTGIIGFSAGAMTALKTVVDGAAGTRPNFVGYIYGPQTDVAIPADAPPLFDAIALDDPLFRTTGFPIVPRWQAARRPIELHAYQKGGHGFGLGRPGTTPTLMIDQFVAWLRMNKFLSGETSK